MEDRRSITINKDIFGAAKGKDDKTYSILRKPKGDAIKIEEVTATNWNEEGNEWTEAIVYPDSGAELVKFHKSETLKSVLTPKNAKMVLLGGPNINNVQLSEGTVLVSTRECPNLTEIYLPNTVKMAVLHPNTTVVNFDDFNKNDEAQVVYNSKKGTELNEIEGVRPIMVDILTKINNEIDERDKNA